MMMLFDFPGSASAFRARIALNLKGVSYQRSSIDISKGQQFSPQYLAVNPVGLLPALVIDGKVFTESLAIIELIEEMHPEPALLPKTPADRARVRAIALSIACGIQPLHPPRVTSYLTNELKLPLEKVDAWCARWIEKGMAAVEKLLSTSEQTGEFCHGNTVTLADIVLIPQMYSGIKRKIDFAASTPVAWRIYRNCMSMREFASAAPDETMRSIPATIP